ncbi:MAG: hypothetical protein AB7O96_10380 [Pseudobdellovibrionaceae bacterium]
MFQLGILLAVVFSSLISCGVLAQGEVYIVEREIGKLRTVLWPDGRVAITQLAFTNPTRFMFDAKVADTFCSSKSGQNCKIGIPTKLIRVRFVWIENPLHPDRIGEVVESKNEDSEFRPFLHTVFFTKVDRLAGTTEANDLPNETLTCDSFEFLNESQKEAPENLNVPVWSAEYNLSNGQTGNNENTTIGSFYDVNFKKYKGNGIRLESMAPEYLSLANLIGVIIGQVSTLTVQKENSVCEVQLKPTLRLDLDHTDPEMPLSPEDHYSDYTNNKEHTSLMSNYVFSPYLFNGSKLEDYR